MLFIRLGFLLASISVVLGTSLLSEELTQLLSVEEKVEIFTATFGPPNEMMSVIEQCYRRHPNFCLFSSNEAMKGLIERQNRHKAQERPMEGRLEESGEYGMLGGKVRSQLNAKTNDSTDCISVNYSIKHQRQYNVQKRLIESCLEVPEKYGKLWGKLCSRVRANPSDLADLISVKYFDQEPDAAQKLIPLRNYCSRIVHSFKWRQISPSIRKIAVFSFLMYFAVNSTVIKFGEHTNLQMAGCVAMGLICLLVYYAMLNLIPDPDNWV